MDKTSAPASVAVIDWNTSGHHPTYLREYVAAFADGGIPVVVLSPEPPALDPLPSGVVWREIPTIAWIKKRRLYTTRVARWLYARLLARTLREAAATLGAPCASAFFGCFHEAQSKLAAQILSVVGLRSAGLYVQAGIFHSGDHRKNNARARKVATILRHRKLDTVFMLDETMTDEVAAFAGKPVALLPDITDDRLDSSDPLPATLGLVPKQRPVIGLLGHLRPSKGIAEMLAFARSVPDLDVTFLLAGSCRWAEFTPEEESFIKRTCAEDPRILFHPGRIPAETTYNALVRACDVLWAVYCDCPHSSNTLAKAAVFERPVVVADGFLMARQVRRFRLGEVVPPGDAAALRAALVPLLTDAAGWRARHSPRWAEFREERSNARFRQRLREWALASG
jgi:glycosyltransferase involved in cell wall biosynthesis